ncbi:3-carboxy-cis,cis-muconate cycloisomerase like protein [Zymoseptoria brevis]|uniref:3-carboxy-cis,cis-muconate cycloisomerase like protein n=1 Tax=Zymoseptoria brevis TaxID=1047168 RepID=A0A0F4GIH2_9PEZI|nr:3-carboxy-cis,cis-muconate cycloisomerase like protein [Zymoseptoria brevis]
MTAITDSQIFGNVFSTPEVAKIWSDRQRTQYYLDFEAALAKAQAGLGIIPQKACDEIVKHCTLDQLDFDLLRQQTELIGYPVLPVVQQLVKKINAVEDRLGEWIHWGTTTQDLTDTATVLQLRDTILLVEKSLDTITNALIKLCKDHKTRPMAARSNLQQAVPISFGFKMARLLATFNRHRQRLLELKPRLLVLEFSGAAGTLATITPSTSYSPAAETSTPLALQCQSLLARHLDLAVPSIAWHTERDTFAEFSTYLSLLTATCAKFATDLKLMMQTEVNEAREPYVAHRGSSSTMPQKRNPIGCAYICSMASSVRAMSGGMVEAMVADHERSTGPWEIEWVMLPQLCALSVACLKQTGTLLEGLEVDVEGMARNLEISKGAIVSEAVMMGLGKKVGRQYAHDLVYGLCRRAQVEGRALVELLREDEEVKRAELEEGELERLCDPGNYLGLSGVMVEMVLEETGSQV